MVHLKGKQGWTYCGIKIKVKKVQSTSAKSLVTCPHCLRIKANEPKN